MPTIRGFLPPAICGVKHELAKIKPLIPIAEAKLMFLSAAMDEANGITKDFKPSGIDELKPTL
jgi:hypothetical protein